MLILQIRIRNKGCHYELDAISCPTSEDRCRRVSRAAPPGPQADRRAAGKSTPAPETVDRSAGRRATADSRRRTPAPLGGTWSRGGLPRGAGPGP